MSKKDFSNKQEKLIANSLNWSVVKGSGARHLYPGDIYSDEWLGECKTHVEAGKLIQFNFKVWNKIVDESMSVRKYPVLFVDDGSQSLSKTWCICPILPPDTCLILKYPFRLHKSSISFNHEKMLKIKKDDEHMNNKCIIYSFMLGDQSIYLMHFQDFLTFYGE